MLLAFPVEASLNHLPKFDVVSVLLEDWKERLEEVVRLSNVSQHFKAELTLNTLEGEAKKSMMLQSAKCRHSNRCSACYRIPIMMCLLKLY